MYNKFDRGDQVIYIPWHAKGDDDHPDCQYGFVTSDPGEDTVFVRYFSNIHFNELRTKSGSERTPREFLKPFIHHSRRIIEDLLEEFC